MVSMVEGAWDPRLHPQDTALSQSQGPSEYRLTVRLSHYCNPSNQDNIPKDIVSLSLYAVIGDKLSAIIEEDEQVSIMYMSL